MKEFFTKIHYSSDLSFAERLVSFVLTLGVPFYWAASQIKNILYDSEILISEKINGAYVISIGNITTGGVGKTPIVAQIADYLANNYKVAIISRGYGGTLDNEKVNVVKSDGLIKFNAKEAGDEPFWLSQNTDEKVCVLTCKSRVDAAKYAVEKLNCNMIVLDDGFQHRKIARDLDVVVIDAFKLFGNSSVLPKGPLREPLFNIERASKFILTNKNLSLQAFENVRKIIAKTYRKPVVCAEFVPDKIYDIKTGFKLQQREGNVGAFCAIGQPMSFYSYLKKYNIKFIKNFDDHYNYSQADVDLLVAAAKANNVNVLITTEKDAVKLVDFDFRGVQFYALKLKSTFNVEELLNG